MRSRVIIGESLFKRIQEVSDAPLPRNVEHVHKFLCGSCDSGAFELTISVLEVLCLWAWGAVKLGQSSYRGSHHPSDVGWINVSLLETQSYLAHHGQEIWNGSGQWIHKFELGLETMVGVHDLATSSSFIHLHYKHGLMLYGIHCISKREPVDSTLF